MSLVLTAKGSVWLENPYSPEAITGVSILAVAAAVSLVAVVGMLIAIVISSFKTGHALIRSHLGAYFVSLIIAEIVQATGSLMSARWIILRKVELGHFCATQGALKNAGNVSTALWSMIIAFHTFTLIFLKVQVVPWVFYCTLITTWSVVGFVVVLGPAALATPDRGPFWGISGYWCWITESYSLERFTMEYLFMFLTAGVSLVLYTLIFLRLRGNIDGVGFRIFFCRAQIPWQRDSRMSDPQIARVGKSMLWYPMAYVVLILPIAACRWSEIYGSKVPFGVTIFADTVFVLSGLANAVLYSTTRRVAPIKAIIPSLGSRKTSKGTETFQSSGREEEKSLTPTFNQAEQPYSGRHYQPALPQQLEEGRIMPETQTFQMAARGDHPFSLRSRAASIVSIEEAGYPGPQVKHAAEQSSIQPQGHETASVASDAQSRGGTFDRDWI